MDNAQGVPAVAEARARIDSIQAAVLRALDREPVDAVTVHALSELVGSLMLQRLRERPATRDVFVDVLWQLVDQVGSVEVEKV